MNRMRRVWSMENITSISHEYSKRCIIILERLLKTEHKVGRFHSLIEHYRNSTDRHFYEVFIQNNVSEKDNFGGVGMSQ